MAKRIIDKMARSGVRHLITNLDVEARNKVCNITQETIRKALEKNAKEFVKEGKVASRNFGLAAIGMTSIGVGTAIAERKGYLYPPPMPGMSYNETLDSIMGKKTDAHKNNERIESKSTKNLIKEGGQSIFTNELDGIRDKSLTETVTSAVGEVKNEPISMQGAAEVSKAITKWGASHTPYLEEILQPVLAVDNILRESNPIKSDALQSLSELARKVTHSLLNGGSLDVASPNTQSRFIKDEGFDPEEPELSDNELGINLNKNNSK